MLMPKRQVAGRQEWEVDWQWSVYWQATWYACSWAGVPANIAHTISLGFYLLMYSS